MMEEARNHWNMKLHEEAEIDDYWTILRVPGGWIYSGFMDDPDGGISTTSVFVPFSHEFSDDG